MGADLIVSALVIDKDRKPDFEAGRAFIQSVPTGPLEEAYVNIHGEPPFDDDDEEPPAADDDGFTVWSSTMHAQARKYFTDAVTELERWFDPTEYGPRDVTTIFVRGAWVYVSGGLSWGDSPGEGYDTINSVMELDGLQEALGFEPQLWPQAEQEG